jgi:hypothetical protein
VVGRGDAAMCGIGRGAMAGRGGGGAGRDAGAAGRAIAGGGAGRAMAGGGAGRAKAGGGAVGRVADAGGPGLLCSWADELTLVAAAETPRRNAARRRSRARMIVSCNSLIARRSQRATTAIDRCVSLRLCDAG